MGSGVGSCVGSGLEISVFAIHQNGIPLTNPIKLTDKTTINNDQLAMNRKGLEEIIKAEGKNRSQENDKDRARTKNNSKISPDVEMTGPGVITKGKKE